jgi:sulfide dehydrogenase cytochrome subunit|tara:strand:- start:137 stop:433 length:297 start_codon:yes stop_codon:yes gene_type:complete
MKITQIIVMIFFLSICKAAFADQTRIFILVDLCNSCHRSGVGLITAIPGIDHLSAEQIAEKVKDYKYGNEESTIMQRISKGFSDIEIENISKYISKND